MTAIALNLLHIDKTLLPACPDRNADDGARAPHSSVEPIQLRPSSDRTPRIPDPIDDTPKIDIALELLQHFQLHVRESCFADLGLHSVSRGTRRRAWYSRVLPHAATKYGSPAVDFITLLVEHS